MGLQKSPLYLPLKQSLFLSVVVSQIWQYDFYFKQGSNVYQKDAFAGSLLHLIAMVGKENLQFKISEAKPMYPTLGSNPCSSRLCL